MGETAAAMAAGYVVFKDVGKLVTEWFDTGKILCRIIYNFTTFIVITLITLRSFIYKCNEVAIFYRCWLC